MADIFISYARGDRERAAQLAAALEGAGYSVWWDRHVLAGSEFSEEIERELKSAKAVIVAWSVNGVKSRWVKDEAVIAQDASKIVPVTLDGTESPIGFRQVHMIDLKDWKGATDAAPFATLKDSIATKVGAHAIPAAAAPKPGFRISVRPLVAGGALLVLAIGIVGGLFLRPWHNPSKAAAPPPAAAEAEVAPNAQDASIAVLAFNNMSGDKDNEYFSDGISEELLNDLAQVPGLHVAARTSSFSFKGKNASIADIAKALNVRAVLEGSVRRAGTRVRITAQLINAADGYHMWSQDYDREIADIFAVQDEIAKAITRELTGKLLAPSGISAAGKPKINPEAYTAILQGRFFMAKRNKPDVLRAVDFFKQAIALEPNYVDAHAGLGQTYARLYTNGQSRTALQPAKDATATALRLDPDNVQALTTQITIAVGEWDWQEAELGLRQVMKLSPNDADVRHQNAVRFFYLNLPEAALMGNGVPPHSILSRRSCDKISAMIFIG
jgi:adenylate cyclase